VSPPHATTAAGSWLCCAMTNRFDTHDTGVGEDRKGAQGDGIFIITHIQDTPYTATMHDALPLIHANTRPIPTDVQAMGLDSDAISGCGLQDRRHRRRLEEPKHRMADGSGRMVAHGLHTH
jgi:hypothetical protein